MSSTGGLISLALLFAYMISKTMGKELKEAIQRRRFERSKRRKLRRDMRKAETMMARALSSSSMVRSEQNLLNISKKKKGGPMWAKVKKKKQMTNKMLKRNAVSCPQCNQKLWIRARHTGNTKCPSCGFISSARRSVNGREMMEGSHTERPANMMPFMDAMKSGLSNSFKLEGRATRSEYWWFVLGGLVFLLMPLFFAFLAEGLGIANLATQAVAALALLPFLLVPASITLVVRRLHDVGKSGWWICLWWIPLVGAIYLIYLFVQEGDSGENMYGSVPTNMLE